MVGVNGDFYADSGRPSGVLMRDAIVESPPSGDRSSTGVTPRAASTCAGSSSSAPWRGLGQRRTPNDLNQALRPERNLAFGYVAAGPATPAQSGVTEAVIFPLPPATANTDLTGPVIQIAGAGGTPIPQGGAVLVARGTAAARLAEEAVRGRT